jgi:hypothetical protein
MSDLQLNDPRHEAASHKGKVTPPRRSTNFTTSLRNAWIRRTQPGFLRSELSTPRWRYNGLLLGLGCKRLHN